jgi:hypothetical protein
MSKQTTVVLGITLVLCGLVALGFTIWAPLLGWNWQFSLWQMWPLIVIGAGLLFVLPPLFVRGRRGLGGLFIPGIPILTTGSILLFCSVTTWWGAWEYLWPLEVLGVALAFFLAALYIRAIGLVVPAIIVGANGLLLQFCVLSGLWSYWAILWTLEPLAVGLALLALWVRYRSAGLFLAACILGGFAGVMLVMMSAILAAWTPLGLVGPVVLLALGGLLVLRGLTQGKTAGTTTP